MVATDTAASAGAGAGPGVESTPSSFRFGSKDKKEKMEMATCQVTTVGGGAGHGNGNSNGSVRPLRGPYNDSLNNDDDLFDDDEHTASNDSSTSFPSTSANSHSGSGSGSSHGGGGGIAGQLFGKKSVENIRVARSKQLVYLVLFLAATSAAYCVYTFLTREQRYDFEVQYTDFASEIVESAEANARNFLGNLKSVSNTFTSYCGNTQKVWPNCTLPNFDIRTTQSFETLVGPELYIFAPLIHHEENGQSKFEDYAWENQGWLEDDLTLRGLGKIKPGKIPRKMYTYDSISHDTEIRNGNNNGVVGIENGSRNGGGDIEEEATNMYHVPIWQVAPVPTSADLILFDLYSHPSFKRMIDDAISVRHVLLSEVIDDARTFVTSKVTTLDRDPTRDLHPRSYSVQPIYETFDKATESTTNLVGFVFTIIPWDTYFVNVLPPGTDGYIVEIQDSCAPTPFYYRLDGPEAIYLGHDYKPNKSFSHLVQSAEFAEFARYEQTASSSSGTVTPRGEGDDNEDHAASQCSYRIQVHPSNELRAQYSTDTPYYYTVAVVGVFFFTAMVFLLYDYFVQRRQNIVMLTAQRTSAIVTSLFPKNVQKRIMQDVAAIEIDGYGRKRGDFFSGKDKLKNFLTSNSKSDSNNTDATKNTSTGEGAGGDGKNDEELSNIFQSKPIADFFPNTTVMFADIVGFTAWSSTREPSQVFTLLETIYHEFDKAAKSRGVFKVETVGDCYVAVAGLPDPMKNHATVMARFSRDCLVKLTKLLQRLEVSLGPDTADLGMRVGLNSGPVTAGVLRGERSRFQLFGDTMNTASRMESTGRRNKIQVSEEVAKLLIEADKQHWIEPRRDRVVVKGKGEMQTYWLKVRDNDATPHRRGSYEPSDEFGGISGHKAPTINDLSSHNGESSSLTDSVEKDQDGSSRSFDDDLPGVAAGAVASQKTRLQDKRLSSKLRRLVDWNADMLANLIQEIVARREATRCIADTESTLDLLEQVTLESTDNALSEVREIIKMPEFTQAAGSRNSNAGAADSKFGRRTSQHSVNKNVDAAVSQRNLHWTLVQQLKNYIEAIAKLYRPNSFHNFEHASHVTMSVVKLFSRIIAPDRENIGEDSDARRLHDHTYGITSDPLTQVAVLLSALVHDVDHQGVPNSQLVQEESQLAAIYKNKSVAEQNSIDLAWELLMQKEFKQLRRTIYTNRTDFFRFRQLMVNTVLATDIMDKDLKQLRNNRWDKAFNINVALKESPRDTVDRKATIVIEHLIQASDVAHTMQHWHIYRKWNSRLFEEMYKAYIEGRAEKDPSEGWYKGELGFLDFYVIPLARKLKECGVFGVSSDEYLQYALANRSEWERKGCEVVAELVASVKHLAEEKKKKTSSRNLALNEES